MKKITSIATALCLATAFCGFCSGCASDIQNQSGVGVAPTTSAQADGATSEHKVILCPGYHAGFGTTENTIEDGATKLSENQEKDYWVDNAYYATVSAGEQLPTPATTREETKFVGWTYAKDGVVVTVDKMPSELDDDLILYAKWFTEGQEAKPDSGEGEEDPEEEEVGTDYMQIGGKKYALVPNTGASRTEYWMGGTSVNLNVGDTISLYMNDQKVSAYIEPNSSGVDMSDTSSELSEFTVTLAGSFVVYLHQNSSDWSVQFVVTTPVTEISVDIPDNAAYSDVTFKNGTIRLYIRDNKDKFYTSLSGFNLYMWEGNDEFFGAWTGKAMNAAMSASNYNLTSSSGLILIKSGSQTRDLTGFEVGNTYIITFGSGNAANMAKLKVE